MLNTVNFTSDEVDAYAAIVVLYGAYESIPRDDPEAREILKSAIWSIQAPFFNHEHFMFNTRVCDLLGTFFYGGCCG